MATLIFQVLCLTFLFNECWIPFQFVSMFVRRKQTLPAWTGKLTSMRFLCLTGEKKNAIQVWEKKCQISERFKREQKKCVLCLSAQMRGGGGCNPYPNGLWNFFSQYKPLNFDDFWLGRRKLGPNVFPGSASFELSWAWLSKHW